MTRANGAAAAVAALVAVAQASEPEAFCSSCPMASCAGCDFQCCETCASPEGDVTTCPHGRSRCHSCREDKPCRYCLDDASGRWER